MDTNTILFEDIRKYLISKADYIQKRATQHHKELLGGIIFRSELIDKYQQYHIDVVRELAAHLTDADLKKGSKAFKDIGVRLAKDSVKDGLTIQESADGIIFLKQAIWESLEKQGYLKNLTAEEFYTITQITGSYVDIVVSKIAFTYHESYSRKMRRQENQKNEFIGMASHELKTPVTSVKAFAQALQKRFAKAGDEKSALMLMKMDAQLDKLTALIEDLLEVTKLETGKLQFHNNYFDFNELVLEIIEEMQRTTDDHKIVKKLGKTRSVYGDRDRIGQAITNLLTNSIKYSPGKGDVIVRTTTDSKKVTLSVEDFGVGIAEEYKDKVFDQFYRVSGKKEQTFPGMGLGLYVSSEIIKKHNGKIWVESQLGKGSTFYFTIPLGSK